VVNRTAAPIPVTTDLISVLMVILLWTIVDASLFNRHCLASVADKLQFASRQLPENVTTRIKNYR